jgi:two-component system response regulator WspF
MKIAIVNDLLNAIESIKNVIKQDPSLEIKWIATNGKDAIDKSKYDRVDLILMNLFMPIVDGVSAIQIIMKENPCHILIVTESVNENAAKVFEAMGFGALDAVCTPKLNSAGDIEGGQELLKKIQMVNKLIGKNVKVSKSRTKTIEYVPHKSPILVIIGASTGGPKALAILLASIPKDTNACFVVVQHVDAQFADSLVEWLNAQSTISVSLIKEGSTPEFNKVLIAGTNDHLVYGHDKRFHYIVEPKDYPYRPSVDTFFNSIAENYNKRSVAVLLTGMGKDGASGLLKLRKKGWHTIAQDENTSVVFGMPKAAIEINAAVEILPIQKIGNSIIKILQKKE